MLYKPEWKLDWWEYCPWVIHQYLELILKCVQDEDLDDRSKEGLLGVLATYVVNYVRRDYEEADYVWSALEEIYKPKYPFGTNVRYYLIHIQSMCEIIIETHRPKDDYPDTYRY